MVTRCAPAVDVVNAAANDIEEKHRRNNVFFVAKETLQIIRRERSSMVLGKPARRGPTQRHSSAPPILFTERRNRIAGFSERTATSTSLPKKHSFISNRSFVSNKLNKKMKSTERKSPVSRLSRTSSVSEGRARTPVGKSYTNRCVKDLLNKIEHGSYTSDWNGFNGVRSATPKLVDFYSGENGGVLDAFLCNKGQETNTCYLIDVQVGDRIGRLLKYPGTIRVGQNGETKDPEVKPKSSVHDDDDDDDDYDKKCKKKKERPYPLSWSEQFQWENTKIITTSSMEKESKEVDDNSLKHQPRKFPRTTIQNKVENACATQHQYSLQPIDLSVIQKIPNLRARQKLVREFNIGTSTETKQSYLQHSNGSQETKGSGVNGQSRSLKISASKMTGRNYEDVAANGRKNSVKTRRSGEFESIGNDRPKSSSKYHTMHYAKQEVGTDLEVGQNSEAKNNDNEVEAEDLDRTIESRRTHYDVRLPAIETEISNDDTGNESSTEMGVNRPGQVPRVSREKKVMFCEPVEEHVNLQRSHSTQNSDTEEGVIIKQNEIEVNRKEDVCRDSMEVLYIEKSDDFGDFQHTVESKTSKQELALLRQSIHHSIDLDTSELEKDLQKMRLKQNTTIT